MLKALAAFLSLVNSWIKRNSNKILFKAGEEKAEGKHAKKTLKKTRKANRARRDTKFDAYSLHNDPNRRN